MTVKYLPVIKTIDAEFRAMEHLDTDALAAMVPLFELSRGRRSKNDKVGDVTKRLKKLQSFYPHQRFMLDLTSDINRRNSQIERLQSNDGGYASWMDFTISLKEFFPEIIPVIQISDEGLDTAEEYFSLLEKQARGLLDHFDIIVYRFPLEYDGYKDDLARIVSQVESSRIFCVVDAGYIMQEKAQLYAAPIGLVINHLKQMGILNLALVSTSFPQNPTDHGEVYTLEEKVLYDQCSQAYGDLVYGDYATIHPIPNLQAGGNGWIPRIELPGPNHMIYHRERRDRDNEPTYAPAYIRAAKRMVVDPRFVQVEKKIGPCWGIEQIKLAAAGKPPGLSPSFWISVRMNIHMTLVSKS